jgi:hypothetical protein
LPIKAILRAAAGVASFLLLLLDNCYLLSLLIEDLNFVLRGLKVLGLLLRDTFCYPLQALFPLLLVALKFSLGYVCLAARCLHLE